MKRIGMRADERNRDLGPPDAPVGRAYEMPDGLPHFDVARQAVMARGDALDDSHRLLVVAVRNALVEPASGAFPAATIGTAHGATTNARCASEN